MLNVDARGLRYAQVARQRSLQCWSLLLGMAYGRGRWRKLKGVATIRLPNGALRKVELHWYEAHGIGRRDLKIKRYLEDS